MSAGLPSEQTSPAPLGIVCGGGGLPLQLAQAVAESGRKVFLLGIEGVADRLIEKFPHAWFRLMEVRRPRALLQEAGCGELCIIGHLVRPPLAALTLDRDSVRLLPRLAHLYRGGDDRLLSGVAALIEEISGLPVVGAHEVAPGLLAPHGPLGRCQPSPEDCEDIACGFEILRELGRFDIGQAVIVSRRRVLAIEAAEGTDAMVERVAALRAAGALDLPAGVGVLVKAPKPQQDLRLDLPAIGPTTVEKAVAAGLAGIAVAAGAVLVADADRLAVAADRAKLFVVGIASDRP